ARSSYLEFGDEPVMLARALPGVPIVVNKKRVEAGKWAERELGSQVMILDDGYQHLALGRDLNLLVLDATDPFGSFEMAPFGTLREPLYALRRADAVIVSRAHRPFDQAQLIKMVQFFRGDKIPIMYVYSSIVGMKHITTGDRYEAKQFNGWNATVMCGIGNPRAFSSDLLQIGLGISSEHFFADHYRYTPEDVAQVTQAAHDAGADMIVTTEKDAVRLEGLALGDIPVYAAELAIESEDEVRLKSLLLRSLLVKKKA
ncbi:MAG TPA: tetraacyldisaccharide 4'-kinase, partial [Blastocatellia bacterium]|nr:tetraacyldisaccharide 4'-kinase [Blastocatellia bacterium]